jgi:hypothetical protein
VYRQIVEEHPGRVLAVYIRNVSRDTRRIEEIEGLAATVAAAGSSLVLAADSLAMAKHAADLELIQGQAVADVASERLAQAEPSTAGGTQEIIRATPDELAEAIAEGELEDVLRSKPVGAPPNVVVEPLNRDAPPS